MEMSLRSVNLGLMGVDYELLVFPHPDFILHKARREAAHRWYKCPAIGYIIDHPDGRILFETGVSSTWPQEWTDEWQWIFDMEAVTPETCIEARLAELGLGPDDFRYIVLGHLHCDHAGGLRAFENAGAEIIVHEQEWNHAKDLDVAERFFSPPDFQVLKDKKLSLISADQEIAKGVQTVELPGHTPGTMGLLIHLEHTGPVLLTSDAMYVHDAYGPPVVGSPVAHDQGAWTRSMDKIRKVATEHEAWIFPGHDHTGIKQFATHSELREINFEPGYAYE
jgi:glyoxylase-like metal-dependent hydrolase (beta-lactamase superfamily II)